MSFKKTLSLLLCAVMLLCSVLPLASCQKPNDTPAVTDCTTHTDANQDGKCDNCGASVTLICTSHIDGNNDGKCDNCGASIGTLPPTQSGKANYTVKVQTVGGMPLEGVTVYIHNSDGYSICTLPKDTDANGTAIFELEASGDYSIELAEVPDGYNVKEGDTKADRYPMTPTGATIMLASAPIADEELPSSYELGDIINDVTLTDINGKTYKISDLLKEKRMVMFNFWYVGCSWCAKEFPSLNASYKKYSDQVEVLALNDYGDAINEIKQYPTREDLYAGEDNHLVFPFFQIQKGAGNLTLEKFIPDAALRGYPTTVIIDRYGAICMIEAGAIVGEDKWDKIFKHFTSDNYEQKLILNAEDLTPPELPTVTWGGSEGIADSFNGSNDLVVEYAPETNEKDKLYSWPFIPTTLGSNNEIAAVRPSNQKDNSYAILYATVQLKPGQAVLFDYFASCEYGKDNLYVLVDGKDICALTGKNEGNVTDLEAWEQCCAYVDPRPVTAANRDTLATYTISFTYLKDTDTSVGDDTVYLRNLRVVAAEEIPTVSYIFRYAATDATALGDGYNTYVEYIMGEDGYYHVKNPDGSAGPLLLAGFLGYTQFDSKQTMSYRVTEAGELTVNGEDLYNNWMVYANASSNSKINGYTPVTEDLKDILVAYCNTYRQDAGKSAHENLWLQLCIYYDAYGKDDNGNPAKPVENPILGLTTFSAYKTELKNPQAGQSATYTVTYEGPIMPRGYLYEFIPTVSGVYRVTSHSASEVTGWIFTGTSFDWSNAADGERILLANSECEERFCPELHIPGPNNTVVRDMNNVSLVAYMVAGEKYYIDIAYYDLYEVGSFTFDIKYVGESFAAFQMASPGPVTFIENANNGIGQLIALGIDYAFKTDDDGIEYAYHVIERDEDGNVVKYGEKIYADFHYPTIPFPSQSIKEIAEKGAFDFSISELDVDALGHLATVRAYAKISVLEKWLADGNQNASELWDSKNMTAIVELLQKKADTSTYNADDVALATKALQEGVYALKTDWGKDYIGLEKWEELQMDAALRGQLSSDEDTQKQQKEVLADIEKTWNVTYKMDEVAVGTYHGEGGNMTETIQKYIDLMDDGETNPERQGCVAVTRELSEILSKLFSKYVFDDVTNDWLKFCFYYNQLGTPAA